MGKGFNISKELIRENLCTKPERLKIIVCKTISTFVSPINTFSLAGNIIFYTPIHSTNREKYFNRIIEKGKVSNLAVNKHIFVHLFTHRPRLFFRQKNVLVYSVRSGYQSAYSGADTINNNIKTRSKRFP